MSNAATQDMSTLEEGYYLGRMHDALDESEQGSDLVVLYYDKNAFYSAGSPLPVDLDDLAEISPTKMPLAKIYKQLTESAALMAPDKI